MDVEVHFIDVGCGNMTLIKASDGKIIVYDCNITNDNENRVLAYLDKIISKHTKIDIFINSHRDADHIRGVKTLHKEHPIQRIWDSGFTGNTKCPEYQEYMDLKRKVPPKTVEPLTKYEYGETLLRVMNAKCDEYTDDKDQDINDASIVLKIEYKETSVLLTGDTSYITWENWILPKYPDIKIKSTILLASHHGSITFFADSTKDEDCYTDHIEKINPDLTIISVGPNKYEFPDDRAREMYERNSNGADDGTRLVTTEECGTMKLILKGSGKWSLQCHQ